MRKLFTAAACFCAGVLLLLIASYVLGTSRDIPWWRAGIGYGIVACAFMATLDLADLTWATLVHLYERLRRPAKPAQQ